MEILHLSILSYCKSLLLNPPLLQPAPVSILIAPNCFSIVTAAVIAFIKETSANSHSTGPSPSHVQSPLQHETINNTMIILASSITTGLLLLLVILFVVITSIVCAAVAMRRKQHTTRGMLCSDDQ